MKITMKSLCALPTGALEAGKTYDVDTARAKSLIAGGYAVPTDNDPATGGERKRTTRKKTTRTRGKAKTGTGSGEGTKDSGGDGNSGDGAKESGNGGSDGSEDTGAES